MTGNTAPNGAASDAKLARLLADRAGEALLSLRRDMGHSDGRALKDAGDARAQAVLAELLAEHRPADSVLSEEAVDDKARLSAERVWIIDPLDGTREYSEQGRDDWAVHVALWEAGELALGVVQLPARGTQLDSTGDLPAPVTIAGRRPRIAVSRTRPPEVATAVAEALDAELVPMGSAGAKVSAVVLGDVDAYVHSGGQYEWDSAAPVAVARAAGLHTSRIDGSPLLYNQSDVLLPDLVVCVPELVESILAVTTRPLTGLTLTSPKQGDHS